MFYLVNALKITLFCTSIYAIIAMIEINDMRFFPLALGIIICGIYDFIAIALNEDTINTPNNQYDYNRNRNTYTRYNWNVFRTEKEEEKKANSLIQKGINIKITKAKK